MTSKSLEEIGYALGIGRHVIHQKEAFEYVIVNIEKTPNNLALNIMEKGKDFSEHVNLAASRVASYIHNFHKERKDDELSLKWNNLFKEEELNLIAEPLHHRAKTHSVYFKNFHHTDQQKTEFGVKVMRNAVQHYLEDIKYFGKLGKLNPDELKILEAIKGVGEEQKPKELTLDEQQIYELWKAGFLQCEFDK